MRFGFRRRYRGTTGDTASYSCSETPQHLDNVESPTISRVDLDVDYPRAMVNDVAEAELAEFGFTIIRVLDAAQVEEARGVYESFGPAPDDPRVAINWSFHSHDTAHKKLVDLSLRETMWPLVERHFTNYVTFLATYIVKWPGPNSAFGVHQDPSLVDERTARGFTTWVSLVDTPLAGVDNGLLRFVPGSHRFSQSLRPTDVDRFEFSEFEDSMATRHSVGVGMQAGEAVVFDNRVVHFSMPNESDQPRVAASFGMRPADIPCVLLRERDDGRLDVFEIDDSFYLDVPPSQHHEYAPPGESVAVVDPPRKWTDAESFEQMCRAAAGVPGSVRMPLPPPERLREPDAFCSFCGVALDSVATARDRRNNAQLVCSNCDER